MLANRLKRVLHRVIYESQSAFVPNRLITDNIMISYEMNHFLIRKTRGKTGYAALKAYMSKAYDRVEWKFLEQIMHAMGFPEKWIRWVMMCTTSVQYSITHAGHVTQFFTATRGLRQGCPFSPYLSILCVEGFSALLKRYEHMGLIHGCKIAREALAISHLFFADYSLIFFRANREESQQIRTCIDLFEWASDQQINSQKFSISFSADTTSQARQGVNNIFGVQQSVTYGQYLGLLSLAGRNKTQILLEGQSMASHPKLEKQISIKGE